jgi:hypothetical protein
MLRRRSTSSSLTTRRTCSILRARRWPLYTYPTPIGKARTICATPLALATRPYAKTPSKRRGIYNGRPLMGRKNEAPSTHRVGVPRDGHAGGRSLVLSREEARMQYNRQASLARHCLPDSLPAWLYLRRGRMSATLTMFNTRQNRPRIHSYPSRAATARYKLEIVGCNNPWADSMRPYMQRLLSTGTLGAKTLELPTAAWAKARP